MFEVFEVFESDFHTFRRQKYPVIFEQQMEVSGHSGGGVMNGLHLAVW
jgi:hypothetical protein